MSKLNEIILHAGLHKTATSSFQDALYHPHNQKLLKKNDITTISDWPENNSIPMCTIFNENPASYHIHKRNGLSPNEIDALVQRYTRALTDSISNCEQGKLIISAESISMLSVAHLKAFQNRVAACADGAITFSILLLTRHPLDFAVSAIQQHVKSGMRFSASLGHEKKQISAIFQNRIGRLIEAFGKTNIVAKPFEQACHHIRGPVGCLFEMAGVASRDIESLKISRQNISISLLAGKIAAHVNERVPVAITLKHLNPLRSPGDLAPLFTIKGRRYDIPDEDKQTLAALCTRDCQWLKHHFDIDYTAEPLGNGQNEATDSIALDKATIKTLNRALKSIAPHLRASVLEYLDQQRFHFETDKDRQRFVSMQKSFPNTPS